MLAAIHTTRMAVTMTQLKDFRVEDAPRGGLAVFLGGDVHYVDVIKHAFPNVATYGPYKANNRPGYQHLLYVHGVPAARLRDFLGFCKEALLMATAVDEFWALDWHMQNPEERTPIGQLVYDAKTYKGYQVQTPKPGDPRAAAELAHRLADRYSRHPTVASADRIIGVPANPPKVPHNLPEFLANAIADRCAVRFDKSLVVKTSSTVEMKEGMPDDEKLSVIRGAYALSERVDGETVVVVDDLVRSGTTLGVIAEAVRHAGAKTVIGIVATKTLRS